MAAHSRICVLCSPPLALVGKLDASMAELLALDGAAAGGGGGAASFETASLIIALPCKMSTSGKHSAA